MNEHETQLDALHDIRRMMQRSSRFISLSGLSGIAAGICGLVGAWFAHQWIYDYYVAYNTTGYTNSAFNHLKFKLFMLAAIVLAASLLSAFYFTWRKADKDGSPLWNHTSRNLALNMAIPLVVGGFFILSMLQYSEWRYVAPASLIFYGLALVNGGKYTLSEIRYLGLTELVVGLISTQFVGYGLYFWAFGFGVLHILYGFAMWWKYERKPVVVK